MSPHHRTPIMGGGKKRGWVTPGGDPGREGRTWYSPNNEFGFRRILTIGNP